MGQVTQACPHLDLETVKQKVKLASSHWDKQKWLVIYNALIDPRTSALDCSSLWGVPRVCKKSNSAI